MFSDAQHCLTETDVSAKKKPGPCTHKDYILMGKQKMSGWRNEYIICQLRVNVIEDKYQGRIGRAHG